MLEQTRTEARLNLPDPVDDREVIPVDLTLEPISLCLNDLVLCDGLFYRQERKLPKMLDKFNL